MEMDHIEKDKLQATGREISDDDDTSLMPETTEDTQHNHGTSHRTWWKVELVAASLAVAGIASLAGVLAGFNNKPQQEYLLFNSQTYNLNSIVAAIATLTRVALGVVLGSALSQCMWNRFSTRDRTGRALTDLSVFDQASRSAWGSAKLIWLLRGTRLASVGAMIMILSLAFDTFAQQLVGTIYYSIPVAQDQGVAQVARSDYYANYTEGFVHSDAEPDLPTRAAYYAGVMAGDSVAQLPTTCSTGNCTYPITPSVGICGACSNITYLLNNTEPCGYNSYCYYGLPNNITMTSETAGEGKAEIFVLESGSNGLYADNDTIYLNIFDTIGVPYGAFPLGTSTVPRIEAYECALWYCLQALDTEIVNGIQYQDVAAEWSKTVPFYPDDTPDIYSTYNFTDIPDYFNVAPDVFPAFTEFGTSAYSHLFDEFGGTVNSSIGEFSYSSDIIQAVWENSDDLPSWIAHLALSMSNNIRLTAPAPPNPAYNGVAYSLAPYVQVHWAWLAFPAALVLGTVIFLGATMRSTARRSVRAWKSDPLPLIFVDVDLATRDLVAGGLVEEDGIKRGLGGHEVRLTRTSERGWSFQSS